MDAKTAITLQRKYRRKYRRGYTGHYMGQNVNDMRYSCQGYMGATPHGGCQTSQGCCPTPGMPVAGGIFPPSCPPDPTCGPCQPYNQGACDPRCTPTDCPPCPPPTVCEPCPPCPVPQPCPPPTICEPCPVPEPCPPPPECPPCLPPPPPPTIPPPTIPPYVTTPPPNGCPPPSEPPPSTFCFLRQNGRILVYAPGHPWHHWDVTPYAECFVVNDGQNFCRVDFYGTQCGEIWMEGRVCSATPLPSGSPRVSAAVPTSPLAGAMARAMNRA